MTMTLFKDATYSVFGLIEDIQKGRIALPEIQRPYVWGASKARDLLDSMYKGFPVGYLLFWETGADGATRPIGLDPKERTPSLLIVDGQQRLTSLYAVITGAKVLRDDYTESRIRIAFRPSDDTFAVTDAAIERDPEYIPDVSVLWSAGGYRAAVRAYFARLTSKREIDQTEEDRLDAALDRVHDLQSYPFKAVELAASVDEEQVAEVFVRINSEGVTLNQADFILTLMSVFWEKGRKELEAFTRASKTPSLSAASPFNWYIQPSPPQLLRVAVALAFRRAVLKQVYTLLRGKDVETGRADPVRRDAQFATLQRAHDQVLDLTNWHEYLLCLERAGFRGSKMISSDTTLLFSYALWLMGRVDYRVPLDRLREVIARWFFMAQTTGRYTTAFESRFEQDAARLADLAPGDSDGYLRVLSQIIDDTLTPDYWTITLPNDLATSASKSPALLAYIAALNILDADALLSTGKVRARLDPAITARKGIERHHIFPRAYLKNSLGVTETKEINQIANMALVEWADNIAISDDAPHEYWPAQLASKRPSAEMLERQLYWHALPDGWQSMSYRDFLTQRRVLMAAVVRDAYNRLRDQGYAPAYPVPSQIPGVADSTPARVHHGVAVADLLAAELVDAGATLRPTRDGLGVVATVLPDGRIACGDEIYSTPSGAADAVTGTAQNGWTFWCAETTDGTFTLAALRDALMERES
ncbi:hypothetical protein ASE38_06835 [Cellulomonas sp. Root930]|nr:hypothetical protein ASE38_06835 [Cellulomonas sp. Root930]